MIKKVTFRFDKVMPINEDIVVFKIIKREFYTDEYGVIDENNPVTWPIKQWYLSLEDGWVEFSRFDVMDTSTMPRLDGRQITDQSNIDRYVADTISQIARFVEGHNMFAEVIDQHTAVQLTDEQISSLFRERFPEYATIIKSMAESQIISGLTVR